LIEASNSRLACFHPLAGCLVEALLLKQVEQSQFVNWLLRRHF
jgi:hypothetical protein